MLGYIVAIVCYVLFVGIVLRFFQTVRMWDEEARALVQRQMPVRKLTSKPAAKGRRAPTIAKRPVLQG